MPCFSKRRLRRLTVLGCIPISCARSVVVVLKQNQRSNDLIASLNRVAEVLLETVKLQLWLHLGGLPYIVPTNQWVGLIMIDGAWRQASDTSNRGERVHSNRVLGGGQQLVVERGPILAMGGQERHSSTSLFSNPRRTE